MKIENCPPASSREASRAGKLKIAKHSGFTLIEMLVVIVVVSIGLVGALSFFNINLNNQFEVKNELIAANLAQEGVELVRNIRDYNLLNSKSFDFNLGNGGTACPAIDFNSLTTHQCSSAGLGVCVDALSRFIQCPVDTSGIMFTRTIAINPDPGDGSRTITCTVSWNGRSTKAVDVLYKNSL